MIFNFLLISSFVLLVFILSCAFIDYGCRISNIYNKNNMINENWHNHT